MNFEGKKVLVCGMARSGVSAAQCLYELGARVTISDSKAEEKLAEALQPLEGMDIRRCLGDQAQPADLEGTGQAPAITAIPAVSLPRTGGSPTGTSTAF